MISTTAFSWSDPLALLLVFVVGIVIWGPFWITKKKERPLEVRRASRFAHEIAPKHVDTIVIGSGPGACACANLLAQSGYKVLMLEQHTKTGGGTHSFSMQGCEWDTGLHYTSAAMSQRTARPGAIMDFMSRGTQKFQPFPEPYDEIVFPDGTTFSYMNGRDKTIETIMSEIDAHDPVLEQRVRTYMELYKDVHQGFVALGLSRILPRWLFFLVRPRVNKLRKYASLTVRDVQHAILDLGYTKEQLLEECPKDLPHLESRAIVQRLKAILAHPIGDYGVQPREASFAAHGVTAEHYIDGGSYTVGPTQNISIRLTSVIRACGGDVLTDATVRNIIIENGKAVGVRVSKSSDMKLLGDKAEVSEIRAKRVICGTTVYNLYNKLLPNDLPAVKDFMNPEKRTVRQSNGHLFVFCKIKGNPDELELPDHNVWYFNGDDLDMAYDNFYSEEYFHRPPVVYIGFPCTKDPTWYKRFPGISNCIIIADGLYDWFEQWANLPVKDRGLEYDNLKKVLTERMLGILYEFVPQIKGKVEFVHLATPLTEESYLQSFRGGAYDTLCTPDMFDVKNEGWVTTPRTPIPNLYVAGSSAFFPGLTGATYGGCICACNVLGFFGTARLGHRILSHLAKNLREENPKLSWIEAYTLAVHKFVHE